MTTLTAATPSLSASGYPGMTVRPAAAPQHAPGLSLVDLMRIIRQRFFVILFVWFLSIGATVGLTIYMVKYHPEYRADALIEVLSLAPKSPVGMPGENQLNRQDQEMLLATMAAQLKSPAVLQEALLDARVRNTQWFTDATAEEATNGQPVYAAFEELIDAAPVRSTTFLKVGAAWKNPNEVFTIVNAVAENFVRVVNTFQHEQLTTQYTDLKREIEDANKILTAKQLEIRQMRENYGLFKGETRDTYEELLTLRALMTEMEVEMVGAEAQYRALEDVSVGRMADTADILALVANDPLIAQMESDLQIRDDQLNLLRMRFGDNHIQVQAAERARAIASDRLMAARADRINSYKLELKEQAKRNFLELQAQLLQVRDKVFKAEAAQKDKDVKNEEYRQLEDDAAAMKERINALNENLDRLELTKQQQQVVQIQIRSPARRPEQRAAPSFPMWIAGGSIIGLALSIGLALLLELIDKTVRTPRDVQITVLGTIPTSDDDEIEISRVETACLDAPHSIVAEGFRTLRANLFFSSPAEQQGVILVTSPSGGDGKSTVAINLAISISLSGRRVLLIDANFRRPVLPRIFPNMRAEGLSNLLVGQNRLEELITPTNVPGLDVLSAGPIPPNPAELLGSSYLREAIVQARSRYDQVIFDGPPVLLVSDAMVLAGAVDGVLIECEYRKTSRGALLRTKRQLEAIGARIFGAVLNKVRTERGGYFKRQYREFYEYQEPDEETAALPRLELRPPEDRSASADEGGGEGAAVIATAEPAGRIAASTDESALGPADLSFEESLSELDVPESSPMARLDDTAELKLDDATSPDLDLDREIQQINGDYDLGEAPKLEDLSDDLDSTDERRPSR